MPRRRRSSLADDLIEALARLPWWACLVFGLVAYLVLHAVATRPLPTPVITNRVDNMPSVMVGSMLRGLAYAGQFVLPMLAIVAAIMSYAGRRKRRELLLDATEGGAYAAAIDAMSWQNFELLIGEAFRLQGFSVVEKGGAGADGGVDLELVKDNERWLVQAKHWRARQVPVEVVRELAGVMQYRRAAGAYVITSGRFTQPAEAFARGRGIKLVNGLQLADLLKQARTSLDQRKSSPARPTVSATPAHAARAEPTSPPTCPACDKPMVLRTARKGASAGNSFWGCTGYPACRGTRPL